MEKESSLKQWMKDVIAIAKHKEGNKPPHRRSLRDMAVRNYNPQYLEERQTVLMWSMFGALGIVLFLLLFMSIDVHMPRSSGFLVTGVYLVSLTLCLVIPSLLHEAIYLRVRGVRDYFVAAERDTLVFDEFAIDSGDDGGSDDDGSGGNGNSGDQEWSCEADDVCDCGDDCENRKDGKCCGKRYAKSGTQIVDASEIESDLEAGRLIIDRVGTSLIARMASEACDLGNEIASAANKATDRLAQAMFGGYDRMGGYDRAPAYAFGGYDRTGGYDRMGGYD